MSAKSILAIDQGTTNTKALVLGEGGELRALASRPVPIHFPQPAWVEQDPLDLWRSTCEAIDECLAQVPAGDIAAIAIANQRESSILWERATGRPAGPCVTWQCRRSAAVCDQIRQAGLADLVRRRSGLPLDPLLSGGKIRWLLDHTEDGRRRAAAGELLAGTVDSWLLWNLSANHVHACDVTNASRTGLLNIRRIEWDHELLEAFGVPRSILPDVHPSSAQFAETVGFGRLPAGIRIGSLIGDSHAALFGHAAFHAGSVKATYGTGSSLMTSTCEPVESTHGLSTTIAWGLNRDMRFALEGNVPVTGSAVQWLGEFLRLPDPAHDAAELGRAVASSDGVFVVPAFVGLGAPYWNDRARGSITGITRGTTAAHVARATLESIAFQVRDVFNAMEGDAGGQFSELLTDGGASRNDLLMQFQADILGCPVVRNNSADLSAIGAAWLAGLEAGVWSSLDALERLPRDEERFEPRMTATERERCCAGWREAVARVLCAPARHAAPASPAAAGVER